MPEPIKSLRTLLRKLRDGHYAHYSPFTERAFVSVEPIYQEPGKPPPEPIPVERGALRIGAFWGLLNEEHGLGITTYRINAKGVHVANEPDEDEEDS